MKKGYSESSPLMAPAPIAAFSEIDLEAGPAEQIQCRICLETDGRNFIAPCKCKGTSKFVHRECLDHWRAVKEGFAFSHCTTCRTPYYIRVHVIDDRKWITFKFRFFVTRDILFIFFSMQLVIALLGYLVYLADSYEMFWLRQLCSFDSNLSFYYICGALLFFALMGLFGCFVTCYDGGLRDDLTQPCQELDPCCCTPSFSECCRECCRECCIRCSDESCTLAVCECGSCFRDSDEAGLPMMFIVALIMVALFAVIGMFYSILVATMVAQRIWQRHYHILAKRMLTQEYVVEDAGSEVAGDEWSPPPLPTEHVQQLKALGLV